MGTNVPYYHQVDVETLKDLFRFQLSYWLPHCGSHGFVFRVLVGRPEGERPLVRPRHRWENNIKVDLRETGIDGTNWIQLAQDRVQWWAFVNTVMNLQVP
jgi:hypothetical protein